MKKNGLTAGFTLIELMVTISIMAIISGVVFLSFPRLNQTVLLNRAARELTLALREAQGRATSVAPLPISGKFPKDYGIHVKAGSKTFFLFSDKNDDLECKMNDEMNNPTKQCDDAALESEAKCDGECVKRYEFTNGIQIKEIVFPGGAIPGEANILFYRPDPSMTVSDGPEDGVHGCKGTTRRISGCSSSYGPYKIIINRPAVNPSDTRTVELWLTGQISITH